jgi:hypothetical protein
MFRFTIRDVLWLMVVVAVVVGWCMERSHLLDGQARLRSEVDRLKAGPEWAAADRLMDSLFAHWISLQKRERELGLEESPSPFDGNSEPGDAVPRIPAVIYPKE